MKTYLVINTTGEVIHTPATIREVGNLCRDLVRIDSEHSRHGDTYNRVNSVIVEALRNIRANVPFNIANNNRGSQW